MAYCRTEKSHGYESCRFEKDVNENFYCSICYNVLKEPRMCRNNEHMFCLDCITEHLTVNSQTCPECNEHLSVDTLRRPRVVNNYLSELKIKCDHASRGCHEFVRVANLKIHIENCGFAPVLCSNKQCGMEINKQDKVHHETEACEYGKAKSSDFRHIQETVGKLEGNLIQLNEKVETIKEDQQQVKDEVNAVKEKDEAIKEDQEKVKDEVNVVKEKVKAIKEDQEQVKDEVNALNEKVEAIKEDQEQVKDEVNALNEKVEAIKEDQQEIKQEVKDMKENISKVNKDVEEVKVMMSQMLEKLNMLELLNKPPSPTEGIINTAREDIFIAGGGGPTINVEQSTEIYSWEKNGWFEMSEMNEKHTGASSFIYKDQLFVVGGYGTKAIETLDLNKLPLKWMKFPGELPYECADRQTVVYQQRIIHIGGYNFDEAEQSNVISELQLSSPCTMKELCQMLSPRGLHGAEIIEDKVLIMGGESEDGVLASVLKFDVTKNECKEMPPLPHALYNMATVCWKDKVIALGGRDKDNNILNDVFMYDCKTAKITTLPSMLDKRCACCAVITRNTIVVMGGYDDDGKILKSVECFTIGGSTWEYLPDMNEARSDAVAEVLPSLRKYV